MIQFRFMTVLTALFFSILSYAQGEMGTSCQGELSITTRTPSPCETEHTHIPLSGVHSAVGSVKIDTPILETEWDHIEWDFGDGSDVVVEYTDMAGGTRNLWEYEHDYGVSGVFTISATLHLICDDASVEIIVLTKSFHTMDDYNNFFFLCISY